MPRRPSKPANKHRRHQEDDAPMPLNKFLALSGIASRRAAADLVKKGEVKVNGKVEVNPAYRVQPDDEISHKGKPVKPESKKIYILMNKPRDIITTVKDDRGRKTVLHLLKNVEQRVYPVGRLDRLTTGLLLLTNDGDLAQKLSHPSNEVKKIYQVSLDKTVTEDHLEAIRNGVMLEDGKAEVDAVNYVEGLKKSEVGIELHSGKNRIVRRIFESLGYNVLKLDRTYYAGLTKKDLPRGWSRKLTKREVIMLKHFTK